MLDPDTLFTLVIISMKTFVMHNITNTMLNIRTRNPQCKLEVGKYVLDADEGDNVLLERGKNQRICRVDL